MSTTSGADAAAAQGPLVPEETAEDLYEHAPCGYLSTLPDGTIIRVNQTLLTWLGHTRAELIGRRFVDLLTPGGRIYHETHYAPLLSMQSAVRAIALDLACADGRRLPVLVNATLRRAPDGRPEVIRASVFDATDRREYERELLRARQRAERSEARARALAETLQASLIPPAPPQVPGLDVAAVYRPAGSGDEVGGDFYDVFQAAPDDWIVVLGDVAGKGAAAAAVTALARHTVRAVAARTRRPEQVLRELNAALLAQASERFCTVVCLRLRLSPDGDVRVTVASGGHPLPLRVTAAGVSAVGHPGTVLGVVADPDLPATTVSLAPGEALCCYTDGVPEARRGRDYFDDARLETALAASRGRASAEVLRALVDEVVDFQAGFPRDDIAAVLVAVPSPQPRP